jgi:putative flippase GtrA
MIGLIKKNKEIIMYLIFGVLTTVVNILTYAFSTRILDINEYISNIIAWVLSVLFAYITNRKYVFDSKAESKSAKVKEMLSFYACRLVTFGIDMALMYVMIDLIKTDDMIAKVIVNFVIIVINYIFSKLIIFKNKEVRSEK